MAKIHGLVYVIVGLFISILSWKLNYEKLIFFFYVGLFFVLIGIAKLIINLIKSRTAKVETRQKEQHPAQHIKYCNRCRKPSRIYDRFCRHCGNKL